MTPFLAKLEALSGWRRRGFLAALGGFAALALPPIYFLPVLGLSFAGLALLLSGAASRKSAFATGWWFGLGFFTAGLYWISNALLVDAARFAWFIPFSLFGLSGVLAIFCGLATLLSWRICRKGVGGALALAAAWVLLEWLRSFVFTGFPWNLIASIWVPVLPVLQSEAWIGPYGLGFLTLWAAIVWPLIFRDRSARHRLLAGLPFLILLLLGMGGLMRLQGGDIVMTDDVRLRLVQPNIPQTLKWKNELRFAHLLKLIEMSQVASDEPPTHVIWAETAVPYILDHDVQARLAVAKAVPANGLVITGAVRTTEPGLEPYQIWNSLLAIDESGLIRGVFDKFHLVPFGEYMPLKSILPLKKITEGATDFSPGPGPLTIALPGLPPVGPLICYEVIFPHAVAEPGKRPDWLLNLTNDSWYGISTGPHQHFATARMRAVEEGLPLVRVANSGISGVIDPYGRVVAELGLGQEGILDSRLPKPLNEATIYARTGDVPSIGVLILLLIVLKFMVCHTGFSSIRYS
ncbi:MAG: apolipoprotein N-acyltransferase [Alphaproteobacteria bacterium]|nr:apolipoprotein N-acyltransferase [Alphaproteobacteria bacterium]